jgi:hypothetical protein
MYDFKTYPQRGLGPAGAVMVRYVPTLKNWVWISQPGGALLE